MTEPIAVDLPPKPVAGSARPTVAAGAPAVTPPKPEAARPPATPPTPPQLPASRPSIFPRFTRKQAAIGASAIFSLAAGIAGVRLMSPGNDPAPPAAARTLVPGAQPASRATIEEVKPETIAPAGLPPLPVAGVSAAPPAPATTGAIPGDGPLMPPPPTATIAPPTVKLVPGGDPAPPTAPAGNPPPPATGDGFTPPKPPAKGGGLPEPDPLGDPPLIPVGGMQPAKPNPMPPEPPPAVPALPKIELNPKVDPVPPPKSEPTALPKIELNPTVDLPGAPAAKPPDQPGVVPPAKEPDRKVMMGRPVPTIGGDPMPPMIPAGPAASPPATGGTGGTASTGGLSPAPDLGPLPPAKLPSNPPAVGADTGTRMEFTKPSGTPSVTPVAATGDRAPTTSYDVDIYSPRAGDTWEAISREFYSDARFAAGLRAYNRNRALAASAPVDVPPLHIVKRLMPAAAPPGSGGTGSGGFAPSADWGAATPPARSATDKHFRVPTGGMSMRAIARVTLGSEQRFDDIYRLNPHLRPDEILAPGTEVQLPPDARNP